MIHKNIPIGYGLGGGSSNAASILKFLYKYHQIKSNNFKKEMFHDSLEGLTPRKKIRIRTYETDNFLHSDSSYALEIKLTTEINRIIFL